MVNDMGFGGAETQVAELARRYAFDGHVVMVAVLVRFIDLHEWIQEAGVETDTVGMQYGRVSIRDVFSMARIIERFRPDIVHAHLAASIVISRAARILRPFPVLISSSHSSFERKRFRYALLRLTDPWSDLWTNVSEVGMREFLSHHAVTPEKARLASNGVDLKRFQLPPGRRAEVRSSLGISDDSFVWICVGSFRDEAKGYDTLLHAMKLFLERDGLRRGPVRLLAVGAGELLEQKQRLARDLGIESEILFLGLRRDVPELMGAADALVSASWWEALPIVLLEGAACGLPCVATDVGDTQRIVVSEKTGVVVPPRVPERLADAMNRIMSLDPVAREALGAAGRAHVESHFSIDVVSRTWIGIYRSLLARNERTSSCSSPTR